MKTTDRAMPRQPMAVAVLGFLILGLLATPVASFAQILVEGGGVGNILRNVAGTPDSGDIANGGDMWLQNDLEVGGALYLSRTLFMEGDATTTEGDQTIFFHEDSNRTGESFKWDNAADAFELTDDLDFTAASDVRIRNTNGNDIDLETQQDLELMIDRANSGSADWLRIFNDGSKLTADILAELEEDGDWNIRGIFRANQTSFDIAEGFMMAEPVQAGDVVSIVPGRAHSVRLATEADGATVIGVVSSRPGVFLAGGFFDEGTIAEWGPELLAKFHEERDELAAAAVAESPELTALANALGVDAALVFGDVEAQSEAVRNLNAKVIDQVMERFAARHIAPIALAGRVPVTVDASFGAIQVGDLLSASSIPGIAKRADGSGSVLGVALEALASGPGEVMMMIGRGYVDSSKTRLAQTEIEDLRSELTLKDAMLADLSLRLESLERAVLTMTADR